jgi:DUF1365 family protein
VILNSKIFSGSIFHERRVEAAHKFRYSLFMLYLDLDELELIARTFKFFGIERTGLISFWRRDYLPEMSQASLKQAVIDKIKADSGTNFAGKVFVLTHPRWFGYVMNPLTLYYCFGANGALEHVLGEITNTPWGERHTYVMTPKDSQNLKQTYVFSKGFHVSPFLPMDMQYSWTITKPTDRLSVHISNRVGDRLDFEAHMGLRSMPLTTWNLLKLWARDPWITAKVLVGIYWQAGVLYLLKKVRFYSHPRLKTVKDSSHASS